MITSSHLRSAIIDAVFQRMRQRKRPRMRPGSIAGTFPPLEACPDWGVLAQAASDGETD